MTTPSPNEALREALDLVFRIEAAGVIMCEAENFERWKETARRIAPTLREADADAYGRTGEREDCFACNGSGQEYGETCLTCGGFGWTRLDAASLSPSSGEPEAYYADDEPLSAEDQARIDAAWEKHKAADPVCRIPPEGWSCSRAAGHEGPCAASPSGEPASVVVEAFQQRVQPWMKECFGAEISADKVERNDRFIEEALELVQATGYSADRAHALVDYVFGRDVGEPTQEVGGVMVTLAALCLAHGLDMHSAGETELARINRPEIVQKIRAKQAAKPTGSALPVALSKPTPVEAGLRERLDCMPDQVFRSIAESTDVAQCRSRVGALLTALSETLPVEREV